MKKVFIVISCIGLILSGCNSGTNAATTPSQNADTKIQNGIPVEDQMLNSMVPLIYATQYNEDGKPYGTICTGTVISANKILTAAHCVLDMKKKPRGQVYSVNNLTNPSSIRIIFNKDKNTPLNLATQNPDNWEIYNVKTTFVHPEAFRGATVLKSGDLKIYDVDQLNDIAILEISNTLNPRKYSSANLPDPATIGITPKTKLTIIGYGIDSGKEVEVSDFFNGASGALRYAVSKIYDIHGSYIYVYGKLDPVLGYTKICQGDSGGADLIKSDNQYTIIGIHSFGDGRGCGKSGSPSASLNVMHYLDWINDNYLTQHI